MLLSGDFEMEGMFHQGRVTFANVNSSTMAGIVANAALPAGFRAILFPHP